MTPLCLWLQEVTRESECLPVMVAVHQSAAADVSLRSIIIVIVLVMMMIMKTMMV